MYSASRLFITIFVFVIGFAMTSVGQTSSVDQTYNAVPSLPLLPPEGSFTSIQQAVQADGKILVWGGSIAVQGVAKGPLARLNIDGSLDNSFSYCHCEITTLGNAAPLPDGKILVAGATTDFVARVIRLNNDGSLDPTFNFIPPVAGTNSTAQIVAVQPDGRFFINRSWFQIGFSGVDLYHFNANGSFDSSFTGVLIGWGSPNFSSFGAIEVLPDGRFYVAINTFAPFSTSTNLRRYLATGAVDSTWEVPGFVGSQTFQSPSISGLDAQSDGSLLVSGNFATINGVTKENIVRFMPAGNVDLAFTGPSSFLGTGVQVLANGKILFGGGARLYRLNSDGSPDGTYVMDASITTIRNRWVLDANERAIFAAGNGIVRLLTNGALDTSFNTNMGIYGQVHALARQGDGKVVVAGEFSAFNGRGPTVRLVRTNSDGTLDATFNAGTGFNSSPTKLVIQPDGKILAIGPFTTYNGTAASGIIRLMSDGTVDSGFSVTPSAGSQISAIELLADGRMYIGGSFSTVNGTSRPGVARLHSNGALDSAFNALIGGSPSISAVVVQPDSKVLIGGSFTGIGGFNRSNFARVDSTGALDQTFNPTNTIAGRIYLAAGGKILTTSSNQGETQNILRRNPDGTTDSSFASVVFQQTSNGGSTQLDSILARVDGSIIVCGNFSLVGGSHARTGIVRLTPSGALDTLFLPRSSDNRVRTIIDGGSDKILIGGDFTRVENTTKAGIARLNVATFRKATPFDFDGDGRADFTVFRPSTNVWYTLRTSDFQVTQTNFGLAGDIVASADFDGDGKTDLGIFRPSSGDWWYAASSLGGAHRTTQHGSSGDIPRPSDFDGDGKADFIVYRPSNNTWYRKNSLGIVTSIVFGAAGDQPVVGDFDGDGKSDPAIFRPSSGHWWYASSLNGGQHRAVQWGQTGDRPVPADYDGDGKTDFAVYRPSEGGWYVTRSSNGTYFALAFGLSEDRPIAADYDGDGNADIAVYRPSTGIWYLLQSTAGFGALQWGISTDVAIPNAFVP